MKFKKVQEIQKNLETHLTPEIQEIHDVQDIQQIYIHGMK